MTPDIRYCTYHEIDFNKWDDCIKNSSNPLVYGLSEYLDIVAPGWGGLILGDYEAVMPLAIKRKYGINYVLPPAFTKFTGIFVKSEEDPLLDIFISSISRQIRFYKGFHYKKANNLSCEELKYQAVSLQNTYADLRNNYSQSNRKNINIAHRRNDDIKAISTEAFMSLKKKDRAFPGIKAQLPMLENLLKYFQKKDLFHAYGAYIEHELVAGAIFPKYTHRFYMLSTANTSKGKKNKSLFGIIDTFIRENSNTDNMLDFAGSGLPGVEYFNLGFGATNYSYYLLTMNSLPFPLKLFKK